MREPEERETREGAAFVVVRGFSPRTTDDQLRNSVDLWPSAKGAALAHPPLFEIALGSLHGR